MSSAPDQPPFDEVAAQYVLGTLSGDARERFEAQMLLDDDLRLLVSQWEQRLLPLVTVLPPVEPSPETWVAIEKRLFEARTAASSLSGASSDGAPRIPWWQRFGWAPALAGTVLVAGISAMITANVLNQRQREAMQSAQSAQSTASAQATQATLVAALSDAAGATAVLLRIQPVTGDRLTVVSVTNLRPPSVTASQALELWTIAPGAAPRSLGLLPSVDAAIGSADASAAAFSARGTVGAADTLAISVEPSGGSTTGAPTGPVILQGKISKL